MHQLCGQIGCQKIVGRVTNAMFSEYLLTANQLTIS